MHKILKYLLITLLILLSCSRQENDRSLTLSETYVSFPQNGGTAEIIVVGRKDWTTDNTADWISIRKEGEHALITTSPNPGESRHRTVNFMLDDDIRAELTVAQEKSDEFSVDTDRVSVGYKGGDFKISLVCFDTWTAQSGNDWIALSPGQGTSPEEIIIHTAESHETTEREGSITFRSGDKTLYVVINQAARPYVEVEKNVVEFDGDGGYTDILYLSNTAVEISSENEWIRIISSDSQIKKVSFEVMRNLSDERVGSILIGSSEDRDIFKTISVKQGHKIDHPNLSFEEGMSMTLYTKEAIMLHPIFTDMSETSLVWSSDDRSVCEVDQKGGVTIHKGGRCTITARNEYHGLQASITLTIMPKAESMTIMLGDQNMKEIPVAVRFPKNTATLSVTMDPEDAYAEDVTFFSSDPSVGKIIGSTLHCVAPGNATIYAESLYQGMRESFTLIVRE